MAEYLAAEPQVADLQRSMAAYYGKSELAGSIALSGFSRDDMSAEMAALFRVDPGRALDAAELTNILSGIAADGTAIEGASRQGITEKKSRIAYYDLTFTAPKSFSVAWALASASERELFDLCHREAVDATLLYFQSQVGHARRGRGGRLGAVAGEIAWWKYEHYAARPVHKEPIGRDTMLLPISVGGDPHRHTHVIVANLVRTPDGHVGSLDTKRMNGRIKEFGKIYQAFFATNMRRIGVNAVLDRRLNMAVLPDVLKELVHIFSKRSTDGEAAARELIAAKGLDWDALSPKQRAEAISEGVRIRKRSKDRDSSADFLSWARQAFDAGLKYESVLRPGTEREPAPRRERLRAAYETSLPVLGDELSRRSRFEGTLARQCAVAGLIEHGIVEPGKEIHAIADAYKTEGVIQDGEATELIWGKVGDQEFSHFTTVKHLEQENEAIDLFREAGRDRSAALTRAQLEAAMAEETAASGITLEPGQRDMAIALGTGGRVALGVGVAGSGKTTLLRPLVRAWHKDGRTTIGVTLAWRQLHGLADAGIGQGASRKQRRQLNDVQLKAMGIDRNLSLAAFIYRVENGIVLVDRKTVVVSDEVSQIGTRQLLALARLQEKHGFQWLGIGDDLQCASIEAGQSIRLLIKALGEQSVPQLLQTVRQLADRDKETSLLFRKGKADQALERMDVDGLLRIIPGGYNDAVRAGVDLYQERQAANTDPRYQTGMSAPTNADVMAIGKELRRRLIESGKISGTGAILAATDQSGAEYDLEVSVGDKLRVFNRVRGRFGSGREARFAENGTVADVLSITEHDITMRNPKGRVARIGWDQFRPDGGRLRLAYGYAVTIDSRQGDTLNDHITITPAGTRYVEGRKAYSSQSRNRLRSYLVTSQGEEMAEIEERRPLGDPRNDIKARAKIKEAIMENMARNLSRQPEKVLATDFVEEATTVHHGAIQAQRAAWYRAERQPPQPTATKLYVEPAVRTVIRAAIRQEQATQRPTKPTTNIPHNIPRKSEAEMMADFVAALQSIGLRVEGPPIADGRAHNVPVDGNKPGRKSGGYAVYMDRHVPRGWGRNRLTGAKVEWKAETAAQHMTAEEAAAAKVKAADERAALARELAARDDRVARIAGDIWRRSAPARGHQYLRTKGVEPNGARQRGNYLLIPLYREVGGEVRNLQWIRDDGHKLFGVPDRVDGKQKWVGGRAKGLFSVLGRIDPKQPAIVAEGWATAATIREVTSMTAVVAIDSGNMPLVAQKLRDAFPDMPIAVAADNDHQLPLRTPPLANVGVEAARRAAAATGGPVLVPPFAPHEPGSDWNDKLKADPLAAAAIRQELAAAGIKVQISASRRP